MKIISACIALLLVTGCTTSEAIYHLTHPTSSSSKPIDAVKYVGAALVLGELSEPCSYGHPEDQIKCKNAQKEKDDKKRDRTKEK